MITTNGLHKSRSIGTKLSPEQYASVELRARKQDLGVSEYVRQTLLAAQQQPSIISVLLVLLQELMALRVILLNVVYTLASSGQLSREGMRDCIARADTEKAAKAQELLRSVDATNESSTTEDEEAA